MLVLIDPVYVLQQIVSASLTLHLFSNDHTPAVGDEESDYVEINGGGYASVVLSEIAWTIMTGTPALMTHPRCDFVFTGLPDAPPTIYGYYVKAGATLLWAEKGLSPFTVVQAGDEFRVTPRFTLE